MAIVSINTPIPGPKSKALLARREAAIPRSPFHAAPVFIERGEGARVVDVDGNVFLDFAGGLGALALGHTNSAVVAAVAEQAGRLLHMCFHIALYEPYVALAERLNAITPGNFPKKTMFFNSGSEAVENAVKIARYATKRPAIVGFEHGFSGRTLLALSLTSKVMPYKKGFGPFVPEVYRLPYPYFYRSGFSDEQAFVSSAIEQMKSFFVTHVDPSQVACIVMELVLGEGGFVVAPKGYVRALFEFCREKEILLVIDEVQTGYGRTGKMFATEHYDVEPDLVISAKSLAAGMPISSVTGRSQIMDGVHTGALGGTYGGNPVACAAALATIAQIEQLELCKRAEVLGNSLRERFAALQQQSRHIGDVRGLGAMIGVELVENRETRKPAPDFTRQLVERCVQKGVLLISAGTHSNILRFLMPLVISDDELNEGVGIICRQLLEMETGHA